VKSGRGERGTATATAERRANGTVPSNAAMESETH